MGADMLEFNDLAAITSAVLRCGAVRDPYEFCVHVLKEIRRFVPYDQGRVFFLDDRSKVFDEYRIDVKRELAEAYHGIFADADAGRYSASRKASARRTSIKSNSGHSPYLIYTRDWEHEPHDTRIYREYVLRMGIRYSSGFNLYDLDDRVRALFVLERKEKSGPFTDGERRFLSSLNQHLDNLYRNFYVTPPATHGDAVALAKSGAKLTQRETDIAKLLLAGLSPKRIAEKLGISRDTVYKHVANIHRKLGVKNELELVNKLRAMTTTE